MSRPLRRRRGGLIPELRNKKTASRSSRSLYWSRIHKSHGAKMLCSHNNWSRHWSRTASDHGVRVLFRKRASRSMESPTTRGNCHQTAYFTCNVYITHDSSSSQASHCSHDRSDFPAFNSSHSSSSNSEASNWSCPTAGSIRNNWGMSGWTCLKRDTSWTRTGRGSLLRIWTMRSTRMN